MRQLLWMVALVGCGAVGPAPGEASEAVIPSEAGRFDPSHLELSGDGDPAMLAQTARCAECHPDHIAEWTASAHARASFDNPWYRASVDTLREEAGRVESRHCAGCHDPILLVTGKMDAAIDPADPDAVVGVTCLVCHSGRDATGDGNASLTLDTSPVVFPVEGDDASLAAHRARLAQGDGPGLCGACHRGFLTPGSGTAHHLTGMDDLGPWSASPWNGSLATLVEDPQPENKTCAGCHAPRDGEGHVSHRFVGAQTSLAAGDPDQLEALTALLEQAATVDVAAVTSPRGTTAPADAADVRPGDALVLDVVLRNVGAAHSFPSGVRDAQDLWIEVVVTDGSGRRVAEAGTRNDEEDDPTSWGPRAAMLDAEGRLDARHIPSRFVAGAWDHTVGARDARVVRYALELPDDVALPIAVDATLRHRRHRFSMQAAACASARSPRGLAFEATAQALGRTVADACAPQPITDLAEAHVELGEGAAIGTERPSWERLRDHGLALLHDVSEQVGAARPSLEQALEVVDPQSGRDLDRATLISLLARVDARQGRVDDAVARIAEAEALIGPHPALARIRGDAYAQVWRWSQASEAYAVAAELAPRDSQTWRDLARARGSAGDAAGALEAARDGLALAPRNHDMLRSQALALRDLQADPDGVAMDAWLDRRLPDDRADLQLRCELEVTNCFRDRQPIPRIDMRSGD